MNVDSSFLIFSRNYLFRSCEKQLERWYGVDRNIIILWILIFPWIWHFIRVGSMSFLVSFDKFIRVFSMSTKLWRIYWGNPCVYNNSYPFRQNWAYSGKRIFRKWRVRFIIQILNKRLKILLNSNACISND